MSYIVLARKYRPQSFSEVYAQEHITDILQNAIKTNRIHHAYLFNGPRGVGKTSLARILAKSLNCVDGPTCTPCNKCSNCLEITSSTSTDVIEIDGASNNSVDDIRDLQNELMYAPSQSKYKVYIIDEVHMLSKSAFNALLKTLEEPPENVIFIFATTEPHKVLPTIISRCQRYDFKRIPVEAIVKRVKEIATAEQIKIDNESIYLIARKADGGMRDALSLMDQVLSYCLNDVSVDKVRDIFGLLPSAVFFELLQSILSHNAKAVIEQLKQIFEQGTELQELINNFMEYLRVVLLCKLGLRPDDINPEELPLYTDIASKIKQNELLYILSALMQCKTDIRSSSSPQLILELVLIKLTKMDEMTEISSIIANLDQIKIQSFSPSSAASPSPTPAKHELTGTKQVPTGQPPKYTAPLSAPEPEQSLELNLQNLKDNWPRVVTRAKKVITGGTSIGLAKAVIKDLSDNRITLTIEGSTFADLLKKNKEAVEKIIGDIFSTKISLVMEEISSPTPTKVDIKRSNLEDWSKEHPELAEYISVTESKQIQG